MAMISNAYAGGFTDPVFQSQTVFRAVMDGMARPGTLADIGATLDAPRPLGAAAAAIALTLLDHDTPVWLSPGLTAAAVPGWLAFHTGAPITAEKAAARFAFVERGAVFPSFSLFATGSQEYPDRSTTLVVELPTLSGGMSLRLSGPGIDGETIVAPLGLPEIFLSLWNDNRAMFPRGIDLVLAAGTTILCLPRTTLISRGEA